MFAWFKDGKFNVQSDVCVDDVCVTKDQFKNMLRNAGAQQATVIQVVTPPATPPENNSTSTDEVVTPPTPVVEPTPEPTPEPTEPAPAN
jgi:hypothetical protein